MESRTQNHGSDASYGALLAEANDAARAAGGTAARRFHDPQVAADVVVDFERFLAIGGRHLTLLLAPSGAQRSGLRKTHHDFAHNLAGLRMERRGDNPWTEAGDRLGIAHDVLATHVSPSGQLRSPDADLLTRPGVQTAAFARTVGLLAAPLGQAVELLIGARTVQPSREPPLTRNRCATLRRTVQRAQLTLAAAPFALARDDGTLAALDQLGPTVSRYAATVAAPPDLDALRVLRDLSFRQARGEAGANAHTLTDLCRLAARACHRAQDILPIAHTPLGRVRRAQTLDILAAAETGWTDLGRQLVPRVQGLVKVPSLYRDAILTLTRDAAARPSVTTAVLAALPRLATDAARTVQILTSRGELVARERRPGELTPRWQPLEAKHAQALIVGFSNAANASRTAYDAWRRCSDAPSVARAVTDLPSAPARRLGLGAPR